MFTADESNSVNQNDIPVNGTGRWQSPAMRRKNRVLDTTMKVMTPENISFDYQITGPFQRVFAYGLDLLISLGGYFGFCVLLYLLMLYAIMPLAAMVGGAQLVQAVMGVMGGLIAIGYFLVYWFYGAYMETYFNGQTLGKRITKMRVISTDGHAIDGGQATLRNFFRLLDIMPFVSVSALFQLEDQIPIAIPTCLFGLVIMTLTKNFQRAGDLVAGTVVVNEEQKRRPNLATFLDERVPQLAELIPTSFVPPPNMARVIAEYVDQRKFLPFQRASEIASHLAIPLMDKLGIRPDTDHDLFLCAFYYKTFVSSENGEGDVPMPEAKIANPNPAVAINLPAADQESNRSGIETLPVIDTSSARKSDPGNPPAQDSNLDIQVNDE